MRKILSAFSKLMTQSIRNAGSDEVGAATIARPDGDVPKKIVRQRIVEPSANLNMRPPVSVYNRFVQYALDERLSYPEALKELMDRAGVE